MVRTPTVLFAYVVDRLRRLPGADRVTRRGTWLTRALFIGSAGLLLVWLSTPTPQRISLANLAAGNLSQMQSWIIVSGELRAERSVVPEQHVYRLTDPSAPGPSMVVLSAIPLPVGPTTISGDLVGGRDRAYVIQTWTGTLRADTSLAHEIPPPWGAAGVALAGLLVVAARRTSYPMFFREVSGSSAAVASTIPVAVRRGTTPSASRVVLAKIVLGSGEEPAVALVVEGAAPVSLGLHSEFTGAAAGELRALSWSQPAIKLRQAAEDLTLGFASARDRDAAFDALQERARALTGRSATTGSLPAAQPSSTRS
jgi:hypothetical protein